MSIDPSRLYSALLNTGLQQKDNPLYQVIKNLIDNLVAAVKAINSSGSGTGTTGATGPQGLQGIQGIPGFAISDSENDGSDDVIQLGAQASAAALTFIQGSIIFAGLLGALSEDNSSFFWDDTNKRMGINNNTPDKKLVINVAQLLNDGVYLDSTGSADNIGFFIRYGGAGFGKFIANIGSGGFTFDSQGSGSPLNFAISGTIHDFLTNVKKTLQFNQVSKTILGQSQMLELRDITGSIGTRTEIGIGYQGGTYFPAVIGYFETDDSGQTNGSLYLATRGVTTDSPVIQRITILSTGEVQLDKIINKYNGIATVGYGVPAIVGLDNRTGLTGVDGAATTLYTAIAANSLFRISADIFATAAVTGTASYTIKWTENSTSQSMVVTATAVNTLGTQSNLIRPDNGTAITAQLTGVFTGTFSVAGLVEQLA